MEETSDSTKLSFIVVGDWGRDGTETQKEVAEAMDTIARKFNVQFIISAGDNFYSAGVTGIQDPKWKTSFENVYNKKGHQVMWHPVLGNHDYRTNPQAQVEYSTINKRWRMPARFYAIEKKRDSSFSALFVFTDTSPYVSSYYRENYPYPMPELSKQDTAAQLQWLQNTLINSDDKWKIVIGHHPLYSSGQHGNNPDLINRFKPALVQSKTDFYICGHDHILEYKTFPDEPVNYLISGGGSLATGVKDKSKSLFVEDSPGFLLMTLSTHDATVYFFNEDADCMRR